MVERLRTEHRDFRLKLIEIEETSKFTSDKAFEKLKEIGRLIAWHDIGGHVVSDDVTSAPVQE